MKRMFALAAAAVVLINVCFAGSEAATKVYGKAPTVTEVTAISALQAEPTKYTDQTVLLSGKIVDVCKGSGCWVEVEAADSSRIICKSLDESVLFPKDVVGRTIQVQGKVMFDAKAPGMKMAKHEGGEAHACPAPKVLLSIEGATVASAVEAVPVTAPEKRD